MIIFLCTLFLRSFLMASLYLNILVLPFLHTSLWFSLNPLILGKYFCFPWLRVTVVLKVKICFANFLPFSASRCLTDQKILVVDVVRIFVRYAFFQLTVKTNAFLSSLFLKSALWKFRLIVLKGESCAFRATQSFS